MSKSQRDKGKSGEREVATLLRSALPWLADGVKRGWQARDGADAPDVDGTPWWVEVKRTEKPAPIAALRQAIEAADHRPPVVFCRPSRAEWSVTMRAEDWVDLVRMARLGEQSLQEKAHAAQEKHVTQGLPVERESRALSGQAHEASRSDRLQRPAQGSEEAEEALIDGLAATLSGWYKQHP